MTKTLVFCLRIEPPQFSNPEAASPKEALLFGPLARLMISYGKKTLTRVYIYLLGFCCRYDRLPLAGSTFGGLTHQFNSLGICLVTGGRKRVRGGSLRRS